MKAQRTRTQRDTTSLGLPRCVSRRIEENGGRRRFWRCDLEVNHGGRHLNVGGGRTWRGDDRNQGSLEG